MESTNFSEQAHASILKTNLFHQSISPGAFRQMMSFYGCFALWPISGATVCFDGATFEIYHEGERALTFRAEDRRKVIDLIAWQPRTGALTSAGGPRWHRDCAARLGACLSRRLSAHSLLKPSPRPAGGEMGQATQTMY
jgi:hypothetical protein